MCKTVFFNRNYSSLFSMRTVIKILFCLTLISTEAVSQVVVSNDKMNIVYVAVDNPISFAATGYKTENLVLVASCGELARKEDFYNWKICGGDKFNKVIFSCYYTNRGIKKLIGTSEYRIKNAPNPVLLFGGGDHMRTTMLRTLYRIPRVDLESFDYEMKFYIKSFEIEFYKKNGDTITIKNTGKEYPPEVIAIMDKLEDGDSFCYKNIIVMNDYEMIERKLENTNRFNFISSH